MHPNYKYFQANSMKGGIARIDKACAKRLQESKNKVALHASCSEIEIFYNLSINRVYYVPQRGSIYFVESDHVDVLALIQAVFSGIGRAVVVEQLYLDIHHYFKGPLRINLAQAEAKAVLVALRLNDVQVKINT